MDKIVQSTDFDEVTNNTSNEETEKETKKVNFLLDIESKALVETITPIIEDFKIENIMSVLPQIIKHVQKYNSLTGLEKKNMIISMLKHIVDITDGPGNDDLWDPIIKRLIPGIIDTLVEIDKGKLKLNTKTKKGFLKKVFGFLNVFKSCKCDCC